MSTFGASRAGAAHRGTRPTKSEEKAIEAVRVFRSMLPSLNSYARAITGNPRALIQVTADNGSSDRDTIYFQPPIALGEKRTHDLGNCNKRNAEGYQICEACRVREHLMAVIYHEVGHMTQGTFEPFSERDVDYLCKAAVPMWGTSILAYRNKALQHVASLRAIKSGKGADFMNLTRAAHPWLPRIFNAIEDARVNERIFAVRPGVRAMYQAMLNEVHTEGIPQVGTDKRVMWRDCADDFQIVLAIYGKLAGYDISDWFRWNITTAVQDVKLNALLDQFTVDQTARESFHQSFAIMNRLNEMGFMRLPEIENEIEPPKIPPPAVEPESEPKEDDETQTAPEPTGSPEDGDDGDDSESSDAQPDTGSKEDSEDAESGDDPGEGDSPDSKGESGKDGAPGGDESTDSSVDQGEGPDSEAESGKAQDDQDGSGSGRSSGVSTSDSHADPSDGEQSDPEGKVDESREDQSSGSNEADEEPSKQEVGGGGSDSEGQDRDNGESSSDDRSNPDSGDDGPDSDPDGVVSESTDSIPGSDDLSETEGTGADVQPSSRDDGGETLDTGAATEPIEVDITIDPNESSIFGNPEDASIELGEQLNPDTRSSVEAVADTEALRIAIEQGSWFETPARGVDGVSINKPNEGGWPRGMSIDEIRRGENKPQVTAADLRAPRMKMRLIFEANRRAKMLRHQKSGKINTAVLGKRAPLGDPRLFQTKRLPGKLDYHVTIGMDLSGSTDGMNLMIEKNAIYAQAELLNGLGIPFSIYGHSGMVWDSNLHIYPVKTTEQHWDDNTKELLMNLTAISANLDGHALEFLRKRADEANATHKIILYYSDGKMPAENGPEERVVLKREIDYCRRAGHTLIGVGIRTDSPSQHGLDTVQLDDMTDLPKVIDHLGKYLAKVNAR